MIPFNNDLQVGQPAMVINVEQEKNRDKIGIVVVVEELLSLEDSKQRILGGHVHVKEPYAFFTHAGCESAIIQRYLMPLPPLDDVLDVTHNLNLTETA